MADTFIVAGNWKMNKTPRETREFLKTFSASFRVRAGRELLLFPPSTNLFVFNEDKPAGVRYGGQHCHFEASGAFTGEVSIAMMQELGATHCLVGHSERRTLFGETNEIIAKKIKALQVAGLIPVLCIGESENERTKGETLAVIRRQLEEGLRFHETKSPLVVAYEPVWAIGTGKVATPEDVKDAHAFIRGWLDSSFGMFSPILYGGSVSAKNSKELESVENVNGFLIGGASLQPDSLLAIYG